MAPTAKPQSPLLPAREERRAATLRKYIHYDMLLELGLLIRPWGECVLAELFTRFAAELALFAGVGFLLFAINDLLVDLIYFARRAWRSVAIYSRFPKSFASAFPRREQPGLFAIFVPAWDEATVIASMLRATLKRLDYTNYRIFVGYYGNDPATAAAIASVDDSRIEPVRVEAHGPTTKADCLNYLYGIM
jgi:adsorption protein B